ncbi:hypothetical protein [Texcoconibacillus texcoconensis]|uniref:Uncharacterized protein n=1 Tax=Texcoconibacillus texcoconensis TaxID=1095777 RepID=A0A840QPS4_9BACI|nr:hypothetical protein [Texcoconibacillus texcoconensis]MBB5173359.1 hypothetical protein [Texcoconibacillus texcoconensis]
MNSSLDKTKAIELAEKFGIQVSFDNPESGVFLNNKENNQMTKYELEEFLPELKGFDKDFIVIRK